MLNILSLHFFIIFFTNYVITLNLHVTKRLGPMLLSVIEGCPLYGGIVFCHTLFRNENDCLLYADVRCVKFSVNGGSPVSGFAALHL